MNTDEFLTRDSYLSRWPQGFENVTCPRAQILIGGMMLHGASHTPLHVEQTFRAIGAETQKNHISVYQAAVLMNQVTACTQQYMEICDLVAIHGGGREALDHKYRCIEFFEKLKVEFIDFLETYRSLDMELEDVQSNCEFPELINVKSGTHS